MCCHAHMATSKRKAKQRPTSGRPTNLYLPADLRDRLDVVSAQTGIPMSRIAADGIRWRLAQLEKIVAKGAGNG